MKHPRPSKYRNHRVEIDGIVFDSKAEARRFCDLKMLERAGVISNLKPQVRFPIVFNGVKICDYIADAVYTETASGTEIIEDTKGAKTPVYRMKFKLMAALGKHITEVKA